MTRRYAWLAAQAAVSMSVLAWLIRGLDGHALGRLLTTLPVSFYLVSLAVILAGQALYAWRWWLLLAANGLQISVGTAIRYYFIGIFVNNFLPSTVGGDAAKVYYLGRAHGYRTVVASVVVDRILGLGSLAGMAAMAAWLVPPVSARFVVLRLVVTALAFGTLVVIALALVGTGGSVRWLAPFGPRAAALGERLQRLRLDMAVPLTQPRTIVFAVLVVLLYFASLSGVYAWFIGISGVARPGWVAIFTAVSMTGVLSNLPIALNGLGVREQLHVWLFAPLGVPPEIAVAVSLLLFGHILVASACGLVLWLLEPRVSAGAGPMAGLVAEPDEGRA